MWNLHGKRYVVTGVATDKSIAWAIALKLREAGAHVQLLCQDIMLKRALRLTEPLGMQPPILYDAANAAVADECFAKLAQDGIWDGFVHSIAYSDAKELKGRFIDGSRDNFRTTMEVSCFSLIDIAKRSEPLMPNGGSIITITFDASRGSYPHYNMMGLAKAALEIAVNYAATDLGASDIRVNGIAASPEDTLAARGIGNFRLIGDYAAAMSPLGRRATLDEIANEAAYLLSPASSGVTGQIRFVDCGSSVPKMPPARNAALMATAMSKIAEAHGPSAIIGTSE